MKLVCFGLIHVYEAPAEGHESNTAPSADEIAESSPTHLSVVIDGETVEVKEQIQVRNLDADLFTVPYSNQAVDVCY